MVTNGKKTAKKARGPSRLEPTTAADLQAIAAKLAEFTSEFRGYAAVLENSKTKSVDVEGLKMLGHAFENLKKYAANCRRKLP